MSAYSTEGGNVIRRASLILFALFLAVPALTAAAPGPASFSLPDQASEVAPGVFFLGYAVEDGVELVGYAYARNATADERGRRANAKPDGSPGKGNGKDDGGGGDVTDPASCYSYIAKGSRWLDTNVEDYVFDSSIRDTISDTIGFDGIDDAFESWETAADHDIVGIGTSGTDLSADTSGTDGKNEIYFANITEPDVLGYTIVWFTRSRGPFIGQIVEADMVIDNGSEWNWYVGPEDGDISTTEIDFWGVFTHEAGHWVGMGHTDTDTACKDQTMYPRIGSNDTTKQSLEIGDTTGISNLYNN